MSPFNDISFFPICQHFARAVLRRGCCFTLVILVEDNDIDVSDRFIKIVPHSFTFCLKPWQPSASHSIKFHLGASLFAYKEIKS